MHFTLRPWQTRTHCCGHIVAHDVSWAVDTNLLRTKMFLNTENQKHFLCPGHILCPQQMLRAGKRGNISVGNNNVSSFVRAFMRAQVSRLLAFE